MRAALIATAAALRSSLACAFVAPHTPTKLAALRSGEDDEEPAELTEDFRDFRARLIARTQGEGLEVGSDREAAGAGWAYETPLLEQGCVLLGGVEQEFGFGLRQQYFHKCVLLLTQYDDAFTRGVIVNRPSRREVDGWSLWCGAGQEKGDSTSLQRECSARARSGKSIHASRALRGMIARPKISRNERKTTEIGAFEVGKFAPFSCPGAAATWKRGGSSPRTSSASPARAGHRPSSA